MLHNFIKENVDEERIELEKLRQDLELVNADRLKELEEQKLRDQEVMLKGQAAVDALAEKNKQQKEYQDRLDKQLAEQQRAKQDMKSNEERIQEAKEQYI